MKKSELRQIIREEIKKTFKEEQSGIFKKKPTRNLKTVKITIPDEQTLKLINSTPALNRLSRLKLQVGENIENVNHKQYADMVNMYPSIGVTVEEIA